MKTLFNNQQAFYALLAAGLWEKDACLSSYGDIDFQIVYRLAQEQSVVGLVAAGLEHMIDLKVPQCLALTIARDTLQMEKRNVAMNHFIGIITNKMQDAGIEYLLIKGQGIAQCYERPLWRACGDVDFLLNEYNYHKAKQFFYHTFGGKFEEDIDEKHWEIMVSPWEVELHASLKSNCLVRMDKLAKEVLKDSLEFGNHGLWHNGPTEIYIPSRDNNIIIIFTHILKHYFTSGIGLRQICDWCRLIWTCHNTLDINLLKRRLLCGGIMTEWKTFAALAVDYLGMPAETMPLYSPCRKWSRKANKVLAFVMETGNFGHNRDVSYYERYPYLIYKVVSLWKYTWDCMRHFIVFPMDANKVWWNRIKRGVLAFASGQ